MTDSMGKIKSAWRNVWRAATNQEHTSLMTIPPDEDRDADCIVDRALKELEDLRARTANKTDQQPDGWVAWHPRIGQSVGTYSKEEQWSLQRWRLLHSESYFSQEQLESLGRDFNLSDRLGHIAWEYALKDGWRIRPVKLVFLDEEGK